MEIYQLQYFLAIAENGSFTKASAALYVSQPSLSSGIKKLEKELGVSLIERRWRGIQLTPAGQLFLRKAEKIITEYQSTIDTLRNFQPKPVLRIGLLCTLKIQVIVKIIQSFRELYPEVTIELCDTHFDELHDWLEQGDVDIIVTNLKNNPDEDTTHLLFNQRLLLGIPSAHPLAQRQEVMLQELEDQPYIDRIKCEILTQQSPSIFETSGVTPAIVYRADREEWVIAMIQAGMGMSIMPEWEDVTGITYVPLAKMRPIRHIGLQWKKQQKLELVTLFKSFVAEGVWFDQSFQDKTSQDKTSQDKTPR